jgi:hypothetical protein
MHAESIRAFQDPGRFNPRLETELNEARYLFNQLYAVRSRRRGKSALVSAVIGIEVAASLTQLDIGVTLVSRHVDLFAQLGSPESFEHEVPLHRRSAPSGQTALGFRSTF